MSVPNSRSSDREPDDALFLEEFAVPLAALRARYAHCPTPEEIVAAQSGELPSELFASVSAHVSTCRLCRALARVLAELQSTELSSELEARIRARIAGQLEVDAGSPTRTWSALRRWSLVAAACLAVAVVGWTSVGWKSSTSPGVSSPGPPSAGGDPQPRDAFNLEMPLVRPIAPPDLTWRSAPDAAGGSIAGALERALEPYRLGDYGQAANRLRPLVAHYPRLPEARFYLGVCELAIGRTNEAIGSLKSVKVLGSSALAEDAAWYLALAYQRAGATDLVREELQPLCAGKGSQAARACAGLDQLQRPSPAPPSR
jgi:TolA-binding protein